MLRKRFKKNDLCYFTNMKPIESTEPNITNSEKKEMYSNLKIPMILHNKAFNIIKITKSN